MKKANIIVVYCVTSNCEFRWSSSLI